MSMISEKHMVSRSGFVGKVEYPNGEVKETRLFPQSDENFLKRILEAMKKDGDIVGYTVEWKTVVCKAG